MVAERNLYAGQKAACASLLKTIKEQGRTVAWLARETGYSRGYVSNVLHGNNPITDEFQAKAIKALGMEGKTRDLYAGRVVFVPVSVFRLYQSGVFDTVVEDTYEEAWKVSWMKEHGAEAMATAVERAWTRHQFNRKNVGTV